jgi:hypothetical protein
LLLLCAAPSLRGQGTLRLGAETGLHVATAAASPLAHGVSTSSRTGLLAGLLMELPVSQAWSLTLSPRFVEKGAALRYRDALLATVTLSAVDVSLGARWTLPREPLSPFVSAGLHVSRLVLARVRSEFQRGYSTAYPYPELGHWDGGVEAGAGLSYDAGNGSSVFAKLQYSLGFINANPGENTLLAAEWHARGLSITAGFLVGL